MSRNLPNTVQRNPLLTLENARPSMAKADLRKPENAGEVLRLAIRCAGLTISEASGLMGVKDEAQFRRMLDGKEKLSVHLLLTDEARPIWRELMALTARRAGYAVERVIRWEESA